MKKKDESPDKRSTVFQLSCSDDVYEKVRTSIRLHRAVVRKIYCVYAMAAMAGSDFKWKTYDEVKSESRDTRRVDLHIDPNDKTKNILETLFQGKENAKSFMYQMRPWVLEELAPTWLSHTWDSARCTATKAWTSRDPEIKVTKGWLVMQGARSIARFNHIGIEFPVLTCHPKLQDHSITLKWDKDIGPVEFRVGKLDGGRYPIWKALRDKEEGWELGTIYLNENEGKLKATVTYTKPLKAADVDPSRVLDVEFTNDPSNYITCSAKSDILKADKISVEEAIGWLQTVQVCTQKFDQERGAVGNPRKKWGSRNLYKGSVRRLHRVTERRSNGQKYRSHLWTRRIIEHAIRARCGVIHVLNMPQKTMFGHPWSWNQFENFLDFKTKEQNIRLVVDYQKDEKGPEYCPKCGRAFIPENNRQKYDSSVCRCHDHNSRKRYFPNFGEYTKAKYVNRTAKVSLQKFREEVATAS